MSQITAAEYEKRLVALCLGGARGFPKKERDRHVMLMAASHTFERGMIYTEKEVDAAVRDWLDRGCPSLQIDQVTIRRELIDASYLTRDDAGRFYGVGPGPAVISYAEDVAAVDPIRTIERAIEDRASRKSRRDP
ncbi:MAG TPA: DUF2087 domain-containing protein [Acidimicrobiia bacterium]|nr:DUF2087 domain-containing protein [Acidimicrobiia bacterium]